MKLYIGITDTDWFEQLAANPPDEVNFWKPGGSQGFGVLSPGEPFLFKLHSPHEYIVGGGLFVKFSFLPVSLAWMAFGEKNGVTSLPQFLQRIRKYRRDTSEPDPNIGCVILNQPFFFPREQWIPVPSDWPKSTVQGKSYDALDSRGWDIWAQVQERLGRPVDEQLVREDRRRYGEAYLTQARLGQGAFRVLVTDAYERRCAITGEKTLPVLEAAHIKPYAEDGRHEVRNGLLLRSDMHILFDRGYLTVTPEHRIAVSSLIEEQFTNGKLYYSYRGAVLKSMPSRPQDIPLREHLEWHNANRFIP